LNEKGAVQGVGRLAIKPAHFTRRAEQAVREGAAGLPQLMALVEERASLISPLPR